MPIQEPDILELISKIGEHYRNNINNRFTRKIYTALNFSDADWSYLDRLTNQSDSDRLQGFHLQSLYEQILAAANFIYCVRQEILPGLRSYTGAESEPKDATLAKIAINTLPTNLSIFSDMLNELYVKTTELDTQQSKGQKAVFEKMPGLEKIGNYLVSG